MYNTQITRFIHTAIVLSTLTLLDLYWPPHPTPHAVASPPFSSPELSHSYHYLHYSKQSIGYRLLLQWSFSHCLNAVPSFVLVFETFCKYKFTYSFLTLRPSAIYIL